MNARPKPDLSNALAAVDRESMAESNRWGTAGPGAIGHALGLGQLSETQPVPTPLTLERVKDSLHTLIANLSDLADQASGVRHQLGGKASEPTDKLTTPVNPESDGLLNDLMRAVNEAHMLVSRAFAHTRATANLL